MTQRCPIMGTNVFNAEIFALDVEQGDLNTIEIKLLSPNAALAAIPDRRVQRLRVAAVDPLPVGQIGRTNGRVALGIERALFTRSS